MPAPNRYITARLRVRKGTTEEWAENDPILMEAEPAWDTTLNQIKIGNGYSNWSELPYVENLGGPGMWTNDLSGIYPNWIQTQKDAVDYVKYHHDLLEDNANAYFDAGISGDTFTPLFELNITSGTGGLASIDDLPRDWNAYNQGEVVNITATPLANYNFLRWDGGVDDPDSASTTVTMTENKSIKGVFSI